MLQSFLLNHNQLFGCPSTSLSSSTSSLKTRKYQNSRKSIQATSQDVELLAKPTAKRPTPPVEVQQKKQSTSSTSEAFKEDVKHQQGRSEVKARNQGPVKQKAQKNNGASSQNGPGTLPQKEGEKSSFSDKRQQSNGKHKRNSHRGQNYGKGKKPYRQPVVGTATSNDEVEAAETDDAVEGSAEQTEVLQKPSEDSSQDIAAGDIRNQTASQEPQLVKPVKRPELVARSASRRLEPTKAVAQASSSNSGKDSRAPNMSKQRSDSEARPAPYRAPQQSQPTIAGTEEVSAQRQEDSVNEDEARAEKVEGLQEQHVETPETTADEPKEIPQLSSRPQLKARSLQRRPSKMDRRFDFGRPSEAQTSDGSPQLVQDKSGDVLLEVQQNLETTDSPKAGGEAESMPELKFDEQAFISQSGVGEKSSISQQEETERFQKPQRPQQAKASTSSQGSPENLSRPQTGRPEPKSAPQTPPRPQDYSLRNTSEVSKQPGPTAPRSDVQLGSRPDTFSRPSRYIKHPAGHRNKQLPTASMDEFSVTASMDILPTTSSIDIPENQKDDKSRSSQPTLSARPDLRDAKEKRDNYRKAIHGALNRMPSEKRSSQFVRESKPESQQYSTAWQRRTGEQSSGQPNAAAPTRDTGKTKRKEKRSKGNPYQKIDIEKQRASRVERRQQRREQSEAEALEQEEIFEVGTEGMSVQELADKLACNSGDVLKALFMQGIMAQVNQILDKDMVKAVATEYGVEVLDLEEAGMDSMAKKTVDYDSDDDITVLLPRPPVVTVMGHVDHGKTSLLDYIRKAKVAAGEAGGITQAIGAYTCEVESSGETKNITFLDTPGHEAFSAMRARGTRITDVAIIVVAADDGVRPQTKEAISHARAAEVPIVVAINKIDKEGANIERAKQEMSEAGLLPEEWGGTTQMVPISAKKGTGVDELLETVLLVAEIEQLTANPARMARGTIVEATMDRRKGPAATLLVGTGTLRVGDIVHAGGTLGKVRSLMASNGEQVQEAGPSVAVQMLGLNAVPTAGDEFGVVDSEQTARKMAEEAENQNRLKKLDEQASGSMVTSTTFATQSDEGGSGLQFLNIILKADASGSVEAVKSALLQLPQDRVALRFLLATTGDLNNGDVQLATASQANIIGFNMEPSDAVMAQVKQAGVALKTYNVIYELIDDIRALMEGRLDSVEDRTLIGEAEVRAVFGSGTRKVAGCMVTDGKLRKGCRAVVLRGKKEVFEGLLSSLRRVKENVNEISYGNECGVGVTDFVDWKEGDKIQAFDVQSKRQTLEEASENEVFGDFSAPNVGNF